MPLKQHGRDYDIIVYGASGYTGKYTAQHITTHLPTTLKWAVAGRSRSKLEAVVSRLKELNPDRTLPSIEIISSTTDRTALESLCRRTFILLTTVGPYGSLGEPAFAACAATGTHYFDVTGEVPFVHKMITKYSSAAAQSGAKMFPQIGIESAPSDLLTWSLTQEIKREFGPETKTGQVTLSIHNLRSAPSGGTLATVFTILENFSLKELREAHKPYAFSPVPHPNPDLAEKRTTWTTRLTGLATTPILGLGTSSVAAKTDAAIVERTWGLLSQAKNKGQHDESYGPNFSFKQYMKPRNWLSGIAIHFGLMVLGVIMAMPFLRALAKKFVYQPGEGAEEEVAKRDELEFWGVAKPDFGGEEDTKKRAFGRCWFRGPVYYYTGVLMAEAAATLLEEESVEEQLGGGGIYTPACLGQPFIDRLDKAGFHFETTIMEE
ncbi:Saccharopine dehydrogenase-domain-containing protein [Pseudoneurospora amorphoporcata]|uniref:Saccharopine dehydrogenase-domain-containing protein n=1 Tax=Pseudoneurospora amorphoporcata TaxID=241081 RepID=A0AAN6P080_9PEZI|nr:Saccharopine dehydrogenase-domain-containing protein [Pseudoneurospora amorphoporcata]